MSANEDAGRFVVTGTDAHLVRVDDYALVRVTGKDAVTFLHGQFTNAIQGLGDTVRSAGYCTPKGRLLATMRLWMDGDAVMMLVPKAIGPAFIKRLRMYVLRADVKFECATDGVVMLGVTGNAEAVLADLHLPVPAEGAVVRHEGLTILDAEVAQTIAGFTTGGRRALIVAPADHALVADAGDGAYWWASEVAAGKVTIWPRTRELFVPQAVNFELTGGVVFNKGCYPGQEVVSRVQHIGETSRRASIGLVAGDAPLPGAPIFSDGAEVGFVVEAVQKDGKSLILFSSLRAALLGKLTLTPEGAEVDVLPLPYKITNTK
ncbi:MAG: folate-binding protein YgfZ [Sutterella wadsworthensis]|nr:folate-binding protein YgfZ [Sutterella wadsworthensis]